MKNVMRILIIIFIISAVFWLLTACMSVYNTPVAAELRDVKLIADVSKTVTVQEGMVWVDKSFMETRGIRFPPGVYVLEAEDSAYWYFRSPSSLEFRIFKDGKVTDSRNIPGGIMIGKDLFRYIPAAGYVDNDEKENGKVMVWRLGGNFLALEGSAWKKSF